MNSPFSLNCSSTTNEDNTITFNAPLQKFLECINEEFYYVYGEELEEQYLNLDFTTMGSLFDMEFALDFDTNLIMMENHFRDRDEFIDKFYIEFDYDFSGYHYFKKHFGTTPHSYFVNNIAWDMKQLKRLCSIEYNPNCDETLIEIFRSAYGGNNDEFDIKIGVIFYTT